MYLAIGEIYGQDPPWAEYDKEFTLEGGVFENDYVLWVMALD
jgi:hypothetical protein